MKIIILIVGVLLQVQTSHAADHAKGSNEQKAILVTGASSGIGRNIAEKLAEDGYFVYAGARKQADIDALSKLPNVQGIRLDVTVQTDIDNAVATVEKAGRGLYGLVNNAGVVMLKPLIEATEDDMQFIMDVNVFGPYRITKAFAPLIIESKGRITSISSIAAFGAASLLGPYSISKAAVETYSDVLATELKQFGVGVSVIEPGNYQSDVFKNMHQRLAKQAQSDPSTRYAKAYQAMANFSAADRSAHKEPDDVTAAVKDALFTDQPKRRYMVTPNENESRYTLAAVMRLIAQLNEGQLYKYDDKTLVTMLQAQLDKTK